MISLPRCRWRERLAPDVWGCKSPRLVALSHVVGTDFCARCLYPDHEPARSLPAALPCVHLGPAVGSADGGPTLYECARHGRCDPGRPGPAAADAARRCDGCADYCARDPFGPGSAEMHRRAEAFLAAVPPYPAGRYRGRGVVIAGGGERYFASLYVTVRALRHVGCRLPIQVWYLGRDNEMPADRERIMAPHDVTCVDADLVRQAHPARRLGGWELKVFATLHSPFEEVLFLDADCYPCRNPEFLFDLADYRACGAIFWPDMCTIDLRLHWPAFTVADPQRPGSVESGQYFVDKRACWRPLNLAWFYNDHSDYYYCYGYGDKHTFEVAWTRCGHPFVMWQPVARWEQVAYLHPGPDGAVLFVHRCADKFRFDGHRYVTNQNTAAPRFHAALPLEAECWRWMAELAPALGHAEWQGP